MITLPMDFFGPGSRRGGGRRHGSGHRSGHHSGGRERIPGTNYVRSGESTRVPYIPQGHDRPHREPYLPQGHSGPRRSHGAARGRTHERMGLDWKGWEESIEQLWQPNEEAVNNGGALVLLQTRMDFALFLLLQNRLNFALFLHHTRMDFVL